MKASAGPAVGTGVCHCPTDRCTRTSQPSKWGKEGVKCADTRCASQYTASSARMAGQAGDQELAQGSLPGVGYGYGLRRSVLVTVLLAAGLLLTAVAEIAGRRTGERAEVAPIGVRWRKTAGITAHSTRRSGEAGAQQGASLVRGAVPRCWQGAGRVLPTRESQNSHTRLWRREHDAGTVLRLSVVLCKQCIEAT
jgi:hypothetical protein